jgi:hypothetical protein
VLCYEGILKCAGGCCATVDGAATMFHQTNGVIGIR